MKDNLLLKSYVQVCHLNLKYAACIATKPLQKGNLDTTKLSKLCLRIGNQTRRFQKSLTKENDALAISVKRRIRFTTDLHAADAVYHTACNSSFRTGKKLPKKYSENENLESPGLGRPIISNRENVFSANEYLRAIHEEQVTLNRSSLQRCSVRKVVLKNFSKFRGIHLCQSPFLIKLQA